MKVNIIGAGVSGLCTGAYLQMNGFETEIFEKHSIPGGLCTSWDIGEYRFDGCAHWILGSDTGSSFYKMWSEILDMKKITWHNHEMRIAVDLKEHKNKYGDSVLYFYTNIDKFENYLIDLSPEDAKMIKKMTASIRLMQQYDLPPVLDDLPFIQSTIRGIKMAKYFKFLWMLIKWRNITNFAFADKLKSPFLREGFRNLFDDQEVNMIVFTMPMASFDKKSAGYPVGGSLEFAKKIEQRYLSLGGKIHYKTPVKKIITENGKAKALLVRNNVVHEADLTISCADWNWTIYEALEGKYVNKKIEKLKNLEELKVFYSVLQFSFGIAKDLSEFPHFSRFPIDTPIESPDGTVYNRLEVHVYSYDPTFAPKGKTSVVTSFYTDKADFWIDLRKNDRPAYRAAKKQMLDRMVDELDKRLGGIKDKIEVMDFATPATYLRYTNNWKGSTQGWLPGENLVTLTPVKFTLPNLENFYMASHWNQPGGGLPIAINVARDVTKMICKKNNQKFETIKP